MLTKAHIKCLSVADREAAIREMFRSAIRPKINYHSAIVHPPASFSDLCASIWKQYQELGFAVHETCWSGKDIEINLELIACYAFAELIKRRYPGNAHTPELWAALLDETFETRLVPILRAKGHDYAEASDSLSNLRDFGLMGVAVRIGDKVHRLRNFADRLSRGDATLAVKDESIEDTLVDLINYSFFGLIFAKLEALEA